MDSPSPSNSCCVLPPSPALLHIFLQMYRAVLGSWRLHHELCASAVLTLFLTLLSLSLYTVLHAILGWLLGTKSAFTLTYVIPHGSNTADDCSTSTRPMYLIFMCGSLFFSLSRFPVSVRGLVHRMLTLSTLT